MILKNLKVNVQVILLLFFAFSINRYFANYGVEPMDTFVLYGGGYKVMNGLIPFKDYWLTTGPLMDYLNSIFFMINGVNWNSYIIHSSSMNALAAIFSYFFLNKIGLNKNYSFVYALAFSILMYPPAGAPFVDHHSTILTLFAFYLVVITQKTRNYSYLIFVPLFLILAFLCKQTPASYGAVSIFFIILIMFFNTNEKKIFFIAGLQGVFIAVFFLFTFFYFSKIPFNEFITQYINYGSSIGLFRFLNFKVSILGIISQYKFILLQLIFLIFLLLQSFKSKSDIALILLPIIILTLLLIFHQIYTNNENFIFFIIPILAGINHIYCNKIIFAKNVFKYLIILFCFFSVIKYHIRFNEKRKFHNLEYVDLKKAVDAKKIDESLKGLKWITKEYSDNPIIEIEAINDAKQIIIKENKKFILLTNYLFLNSIIKKDEYSPNQWYHPGVSFPIQGNENFFKYKDFFSKKINSNSIDKIFSVGRDVEDLIFLTFDKKCFSKVKISYFLFEYQLKTSINNC